MSQSLLTLRFREFAGGTVMDALIDARIEQAKRLLATTKRPIREITVAAVEKTLPHKPLVAHPHIAVPVSVIKVV